MIFESYPDLFSYDERSMYSLLMGLTGISSTLAELFVSKSSIMKEFLSTIQEIREKMDIKIQYKQELEQQQNNQNHFIYLFWCYNRVYRKTKQRTRNMVNQ